MRYLTILLAAVTLTTLAGCQSTGGTCSSCGTGSTYSPEPVYDSGDGYTGGGSSYAPAAGSGARSHAPSGGSGSR